MSEVIRILSQIESGDPSAAERLLSLVYDELRKLAANLVHENPGRTLEAKALVHEAYLRLMDGNEAQHGNRVGHFFGAAAEAMRRILVENARRNEFLKRGEDLRLVDFEISIVPRGWLSRDPLALDEALKFLESEAPRKAELVKLRYFCGLSIEEIAVAIGISSVTAKEYWGYAHGYLSDWKPKAHAEEAIPLFEGLYDNRTRLHGPNHAETVRMRNCLAVLYLNARQEQALVSLLEPGIEQIQAILGADHKEGVSALHHLAVAYCEVGRNTEAIAIAEPTLEKVKARYGADDVLTLAITSVLAVALRNAERYKEAIALCEDVWRRTLTVLGPHHPNTLAKQLHLAWAYLGDRQADKALSLVEPLVELAKARFGANHWRTLTTLNTLADTYYRLDRWLDALPIFEQVLASSKAAHGETDRATLTCVNGLGLTYLSLGRFSEAINLLEPSLELRGSVLGVEHFLIFTLQRNLADAYIKVGRPQEGVALAKDVLGKLHMARNADRRLIFNTFLIVSNGQIQAKQFDAADRALREALERERKLEQPAGPRTAALLSQLGYSLLKQEKYSEAEAALRESRIIHDLVASGDWVRFHTLSWLGEALFGQKKFAEAEPLLIEGFEGMKLWESMRSHIGKLRLRQAGERIARLYDDMNQPEQARHWREKTGAPSTVESAIRPS